MRAARAVGDLAAERAALGQLLNPYWEWARSIAFGQLVGVSDRAADAEVIAQEVIAELLRILKRESHPDTPFHLLARANMTFFLRRYWRKKGRDQSFPMAPTELPDEMGVEDRHQSLDKQQQEFSPWLDGLSDRDKELLTERLFFDVRPEDAAARRGMTRGALDVAYHRALNRLREMRSAGDVREQDEGAA